MRFRGLWAIALRQYYLLKGSPARILPLFSWVGIDMILWGFMTRYLNSLGTSGFNFVPALLGAVLLWDFFTRAMQGLTTAFFEDVWSRNFLNVFSTPLTIPEYLGGLIVASIGTSAVGLAIMVVLASGIFGLSFFAYGVFLIPFLLVLFLFGVAMGIVGVALVLRMGPAAEWFVWPIPALISPFAGVFYPLKTLPAWMQYLARLLPPAYVFEGVRALVHGGQVEGQALLIAFLLALGYIALACWYFLKIFERAVRTGLLARYSAESVN